MGDSRDVGISLFDASFAIHNLDIAQKATLRNIELFERFSYPLWMEMRGIAPIIDSGPVAEINALKRKLIYGGTEIIDLSMINPDILPSTFVIDKLHEFTIKPFNHRYAVSRGVRKLREAFADKYRLRFGVNLNPESEVCVTSGTKDGIMHALLAVTQPGDFILVGKPTYPAYLSAASFARVRLCYFDISNNEEKMLQSIDKELEESGARVLILNFPHNPTGQSVSLDFYRFLGEITNRRGVIVINDFVYGEMGYESSPVSLLTIREINSHVVETYSLSKAYSVPGWRVGAVCGNESIVGEIARLKSHSDYGLFLPLQLAAAAVLTSKQDLVSPILNQYSRRMQFVVAGLKEAGWEAAPAQAGACLWVKLPEHLRKKGAVSVCKSLLETHQVLLSAGTVFGQDCDSYIRMALVQSEEKLAEVIRRIEKFSRDYLNS